MSERLLVRVLHWVVQIDELDLGVPDIRSLELREGRIVRVDGAGLRYWAREIRYNSGGPNVTVFEGILHDGHCASITCSVGTAEFALRIALDGRESRFVALAHVSRKSPSGSERPSSDLPLRSRLISAR